MTRRQTYYHYLESAEWRTLRRKAWDRDGYKCVRCGRSGGLVGHHKRYRKDLRLSVVEDIETLCVRCHRKHHKEQARWRRLNRKHRPGIRGSLKHLLLRFSAEGSSEWEQMIFD